MKKLLIMSALVTIGIFMLTQNLFAYPISVGDYVYIKDGPGTTNGGEFELYKSGTNQYLHNTFCMEGYEYLNFNAPVRIAGISDKAIYGGVGPSGDAIDFRTAYLFYHFIKGDLSGYDYGAGRAASADALQKAIWWIEGEPNGANNGFVSLANGAGWTDIGTVRVLNLEKWEKNAQGCYEWVRKQDLLTTVPEPVSLLLMGLGLIGLAGLRRKE